MKSTDHFQNAIKAMLDDVASKDSLFAFTYQKAGKSIEECCTYIINQVSESGKQGFADSEILQMAMHYYDEDKIEVGKPIPCKVVTNQSVELSEAEIQKAKNQAYAKIVEQELSKAKPAAPKPSKKSSTEGMNSLF